MKISLEWLSDFVTWKEKDPLTLADRITLGTAEVEEVEMQGALLEHCCVGKVKSVSKHPNADKLLIAEVETDKGVKRVVCGGTNVKEGMQVAFAHIGATVKWHGGELMTLQPVKIRGEQSEGMICAAEELGLESMYASKPEDGERPIMDLGKLEAKSSKLKTGASLREALGLNDVILHINNTAITTRPDLFSHLGFARECVALGLASWKKKPAFKLPKFPSAKIPFSMKVECPDLVPRYLACVIDVKSIGETPDWMKRRLQATGWRSVNLPVDITNYVSMEIGVPLHSFDVDDLSGDVHLRLSKKGESIVTLDGVKRNLPDGAMVLSDDEGIFDLLGIMGGLRSSTKESTKRIYLHSAALDPATIRKAIVATGHRTDAATVYEKGVPPVTAEQGFIRALELFLELSPGAKAASALDSKGTNGKPKASALSVEDVQQTIGATIAEKEIVTILEHLECNVKKAKKGQLSVTPPLHRLQDLTGPHDFVEEIGRIHGYDKIEGVMPAAQLVIPEHRDQRLHDLRDHMSALNYLEIVPLSLIDPALLKKSNMSDVDVVEILNPITEDTSVLHPSTLPSLLAHAEKNLQHVESTLRTFHWAHVFRKNTPEHLELSVLLASKEKTGLLDDPFLVLKEELLSSLKTGGYSLEASASTKAPAFAHPGRIADLMLGKEVVGTVFEIHPEVRANFDLPQRAAGATLNLHTLFAHVLKTPMARPLPAFPAVTYDVTVTRTHAESMADVMHKLRSRHDLLESVRIHDLYAGKPLTDDRYNVTLRFTYRSPERTLTEEEVKKAHEEVMRGLT